MASRAEWRRADHIIPIRDTIPTRRTPVVTWLLIAVNASVFVWMRAFGVDELAVYRYAVIPFRFLNRWSMDAGELLTPFSAMFLHGGWLHLLGNMLYLYIFGDNVEDELGRGRFLFFFFASGFASFIVQVVLVPQSMIPNIGASGAVAGVLGAYVFLYPRARVIAVIPLLFFFPLVELPAWFFIGAWFLMQFLSGAATFGTAAALSGGTAWWAHVGGFVAGAVLLRVFKKS
ncbi:MAG TPA: rhomboid family intramembrane serine protease [Candidatus Deferrimicrobiaceae bacterium]